MRSTSKFLRLDGYVRVSQVGKRRGPRFISPDVQREAIIRWAADRDVELLEIFEELDESGLRADRPLLTRAVERIEERGSDGLVVWRVDRFGRSLIDGIRAIERVRDAGGEFLSVQDGLDTSTDAGRLVLRILLSVAEYQAEGIRASWEAARERAVRRGVFINQIPVVGYRKTRTGRLLPHPVTGPIMAETFRRRAQGESITDLCRELERRGVRTGKGNPYWAHSTLSHMFRSRVYLGEVTSGRFSNTKAHPPLIDAATWQAAQSPLNIRRHDPSPALLVGGLARCASCSHGLRPFIARKPDRPPALHYRCQKFHASGHCAAPAIITAHKLEPYVIDVMFRLLSRRRRAPLARLAQAEQHAAAAAAALERYRDNDRLQDAIGEDAFLAGMLTRKHRLGEANLTVASARASIGVHALPAVDEIRAAWPTMTMTQQRELLAQVIDTAFVAPGRGPANERVTVCPVGTAPRLLPRQGDRGRINQTIRPRKGWVNPQPRTT